MLLFGMSKVLCLLPATCALYHDVWFFDGVCIWIPPDAFRVNCYFKFCSVGQILIFRPNTNTNIFRFQISLNMNMNIFGFQTFTEFEYEYIRVPNFHRIWIWIYSGFKFSPNTNIFGFQIFPKYKYIREFYIKCIYG
jgi:hypothetical protein